MSFFTDFFCGVLSGIAQVLVMQPFEIIKIRLANQSLNNPEYKGIMDCFSKIKKQDGLLGFYKGTLSPLLGIGPQVALQFATNQFVKRALQKLNNGSQQLGRVTLSEALVSGFITGIPSAIVLTPADLFRIQMQTKQGGHRYHGSIDAAQKIWKQKKLRGVYLGFFPSLLRQNIALSVYFGNYEYGKNWLIMNNKGVSNGQINMISSFLLGGISGCASWLFSYPIDYVKILIQSQDIKNLKYKSGTDCAIKKYRQQGYRTFFKGLGVTMLRSFPVNGIGFLTFEISTNFVKKMYRVDLFL